MLRPLHTAFEFGPFRLDLASRTLLRDGDRVALSSRAFDTLVILVQHPGEAIEKEFLLRTVWPDATVEEKNLSVQIAGLRKALGEDAQTPRYVATIPGRGYQFVAPVRALAAYETEPANPYTANAPVVTVPEPDHAVVLPTAPRPEASRATVPRAVVRALGFVAVIGLVLAGGWTWWMTSRERSRTTGSPGVRSLAMLPVRALVAADRDPAIEIGMADALITRLSRLQAVIVRPTSAVRNYTASDLDAREAGRALQVDAVVDAHMQRDGDRVRLTARLIRVSDGMSLWADTIDERAVNLFALEDALSSRLAAALSLTLTGDQRQRLARSDTKNLEAYQAYLKGRYFWGRWTRDGLEKAVGFFEQALQADPNHALAYTGLADAYAMQGYQRYRRPRTVFPQAGEAARRALELDDGLADAHLALAKKLFFYDWDFAGAERETLRALALDPYHADAHGFLGAFRMAMGDFADARVERARALELDPLSALATNAVGWTLFYERRFDEALPWYRKALELDPQFIPSQSDIGQAEYLAGRTDAAIASLLKARELAGAPPGVVTSLRDAYRTGGTQAFWQEDLRRVSQAPEPQRDVWRLARIHYELGHRDEAFAWLERAYEERESLLVFLKVTPLFEGLRADPRFDALVRRIGL